MELRYYSLAKCNAIISSALIPRQLLQKAARLMHDNRNTTDKQTVASHILAAIFQGSNYIMFCRPAILSGTWRLMCGKVTTITRVILRECARPEHGTKSPA